MRKYSTEQLRNVALVSHGGAGKTSLLEAMLFCSGSISRLGRVDEGTSVGDYDPEEVRRKISVSTALAPAEWADHRINLLDTPGYFDFLGEVKSALRVVEGALVVLDASAGVAVGTEKTWSFADDEHLPRLVFVNKMDRENANFDKCLQELRDTFGKAVAPVQIPVGQANDFRGIVDLVRQQMLTFDAAGKPSAGPIPAELHDKVQAARDALVEAVAAVDDQLTEKYLEGQELTEEEIRQGVATGVKSRQLVPVLCGSALKVAGIAPLLDALVHWLPSPADRTVRAQTPQGQEEQVACEENGPVAALVFKTISDPYVGKITLMRVFRGVLRTNTTVYNVSQDHDERLAQLFLMKGKEQVPVDHLPAGDIGGVAKLAGTNTNDTLTCREHPVKLPPIVFPEPVISMAVEPKARGDEEKIGAGLSRLEEEDPTFRVSRQAETAQTLVSGQGELHLDVIVSRLHKKFGVEAELQTPKIPYRETVKGTAKAEYKHKKQTGGRGQYGHVFLEISPLPLGSGLQFTDTIFGGAVPKQYIPAVEKGVRETASEGILAGYPVVDVKVNLYDGSFHPVDSSEMAFKIAASMAMKKAFMEATPILMEPILMVEVHVPESVMGDVIGDLNKKRGRILGMEPGPAGQQIVKALVPQAEMFRYATDLRSITQGRGSFRVNVDHYEEVPGPIAQQIIEQAHKEKAS
ncbi:MAG: elongation factor G [Limnochordaceae bacterium]|nr:elongation factor G [Limnochordaceae bacterium]